MSTINFRCWKCHRKYAKSADKVGQTFRCNCDHVIRVPKKDGGNSRVKTVADYVIEAVLCGGGCALLGFCFCIFVLSRLYSATGVYGVVDVGIIAVITIACGLVGFLFGERAIDWIGNAIRGVERD